MRTSSRPAHRKIRRSKVTDRRETKEQKIRKAKARWLRNNLASACDEENIGRIFTTAAQERLAKASAEAKAIQIQAWDEVERPPVASPHSATYGPGNWESFFPHLLLMGLFILGCVGAILAIGKAIDVFTSH